VKYSLDNPTPAPLTTEEILVHIQVVYDSMQTPLRGSYVTLMDHSPNPDCRIYTDAEIGQ